MAKYPSADLYAVLEVSPRASKEVIHAAYRALSMANKNSEKRLLSLNVAKDILLDDDKRDDYDKHRDGDAKGKQIGNYRILEKIAEGGFGKTYKGEQITLKAPVCIKHAHKVSPQDEEIMLQEASAIWDLRHYGIPNIRDVLRLDDGSIALVMSYVAGPTLAQIIEKNKGGIDAEHVAWISERVLNILKYLHYHSVVHGDIKPSNIIVEPDSHTVVLVDYGLSLIRPSAKTMNKGYTEAFAAPEQMKGGTLLPETDIYGLGMTMIAALGGDVMDKKVPAKTPDALCALIKRLIAYDVLARPGNWHKEDLGKTIQEAREKDFGRKSSDMKPLKV